MDFQFHVLSLVVTMVGRSDHLLRPAGRLRSWWVLVEISAVMPLTFVLVTVFLLVLAGVLTVLVLYLFVLADPGVLKYMYLLSVKSMRNYLDQLNFMNVLMVKGCLRVIFTFLAVAAWSTMGCPTWTSLWLETVVDNPRALESSNRLPG